MKLLSFGASTSSSSINRKLAKYAAEKVAGAEVTDLDLRQFDLPIYSSDEEEEKTDFEKKISKKVAKEKKPKDKIL